MEVIEKYIVENFKENFIITKSNNEIYVDSNHHFFRTLIFTNGKKMWKRYDIVRGYYIDNKIQNKVKFICDEINNNYDIYVNVNKLGNGIILLE